MENSVYWYTATLFFGKDSQKLLFKSSHLYEVGDRIIKRYESGLIVRLVIQYGFGTAFPEYYLTKLQSSSIWPPILSEI